MKFKLGFCLCFLSCSLNVAFADNPYLSEIKEGVPACLTVEKYYELLQAIGNQDKNQIDYLFSHGCILTKPGIKISVLDAPARSFGQAVRMAKIRMYSGKTGMVVWTAYDFVTKPL